MSEKLSVYVRDITKRAQILKFETSLVWGQEIYDQVHQLTKFSNSGEILIFYKGGLIEPSIQSEFELTDRSILNVVQLSNVRKQNLTLTVREFDRTQRHSVDPNQQTAKTITTANSRDFIKDSLDIVDGSDLVYLGHQLDIEKTFQEEWVEDGAQIYRIVTSKPEVSVNENGLGEESQQQKAEQSTAKDVLIEKTIEPIIVTKVSQESQKAMMSPYNPRVNAQDVQELNQELTDAHSEQEQKQEAEEQDKVADVLLEQQQEQDKVNEEKEVAGNPQEVQESELKADNQKDQPKGQLQEQINSAYIMIVDENNVRMSEREYSELEESQNKSDISDKDQGSNEKEVKDPSEGQQEISNESLLSQPEEKCTELRTKYPQKLEDEKIGKQTDIQEEALRSVPVQEFAEEAVEQTEKQEEVLESVPAQEFAEQDNHASSSLPINNFSVEHPKQQQSLSAEQNDFETAVQVSEQIFQHEIKLKPGDLIYTGENLIPSSEQIMNGILNDYSHLLNEQQNQPNVQHEPDQDEDLPQK